MYRSNDRKPHLAPSYKGKAKESQLETGMKRAMYFIQKQIPCQNLEYSIFGIVNMKKKFNISYLEEILYGGQGHSFQRREFLLWKDRLI